MKRWALILVTACLAGCATHPQEPPAPMTHYRVELDIYVRDEKALCTHAWGAALREFGPGLAELVTMSRGQYDAIKCLAVIYQLTDHGDEVVSAGIYVTEDTK